MQIAFLLALNLFHVSVVTEIRTVEFLILDIVFQGLIDLLLHLYTDRVVMKLHLRKHLILEYTFLDDSASVVIEVVMIEIQLLQILQLKH